MAATLEPPPAATAAPPTPTPPATINVSEMGKSVAPLAPAKPGSARDRLRQEMEKRAVDPNTQRQPGTRHKPQEAPKPPEPQQETPPEPKPAVTSEEIEPEPATPATQPETKPPTIVEPTDKKTSPWKLVEQFKQKALQAEARALELEKLVVPEPERKASTERLTRAETRAKELEDEIRYVNYSKSTEFQDKYQKPYEDAWQRAISELKEISVTDPVTQQPRVATAEDLMTIVQMPLGQARQAADELFGAFSDDVMAHRKEIKGLFEAQHKALEDAKKNGATREQERQQQIKAVVSEISAYVKGTWDKVNASMLEDPTYGVLFKPREGDEDWNQRLAKGFELVDRAFNENPHDPRLTAEDRAKIIKRHAAVRNRAASWGALRNELTKKEARIAELEKELTAIKSTTPTTEAGQAASTIVNNGGSARERMFADLQRRAKPI